MSTALWLRESPRHTLHDVAEAVNTDSIQEWGGVTSEVQVLRGADHLEGIILAGSDPIRVTADGIAQLAGFLDVPRPFLSRLDAEMQQYILMGMLQRHTSQIGVAFGEDGIHAVYNPSQIRLAPASVVDTALKIFPEDAPVVEWEANSDVFRFDVMVPEGFDRAIGGDPGVNDITRGGLRFHQNRKQNLAPSVSSFLYRLVCTNGMEIPESGLRVDARGQSVEEVIADLERAAQHAFGQVEDQINHFYALRDQVIDGDVTQAVLRMARERGIPNRTAQEMALLVPDQLDPADLGHPVSRFDIVNLFTNQANNPAMNSRIGPRRQLQIAGGTIVQDEAARCGHCHQRLQ